jgi:hypothetical protein
VAVLTQPGHENKTYELASDSAFTLGDPAAEVTKQTGVHVTYKNLAVAEFEAALLGGLRKSWRNCLLTSHRRNSCGSRGFSAGLDALNPRSWIAALRFGFATLRAA